MQPDDVWPLAIGLALVLTFILTYYWVGYVLNNTFPHPTYRAAVNNVTTLKTIYPI
jgi:hypothetical protein